MNKLIITLLYLPTLLARTAQTWLLPRPVFIAVYQPASEDERNRSEYLRNKQRNIDYHMRKPL